MKRFTIYGAKTFAKMTPFPSNIFKIIVIKKGVRQTLVEADLRRSRPLSKRTFVEADIGRLLNGSGHWSTISKSGLVDRIYSYLYVL